ncbi:alpha/beta hydrolase [Lentzea californiensis]|uniref:alpha/beta hydrolase n=1 Tax=Lentzea californiensis TaxID=438851 RepID=UPI0021660D2A|nr:alpha/beta hydrolase [Lentzea californiensis]MCR3750383.1 alpha/beta hydrolase fold [Lentzea californiensis]
MRRALATSLAAVVLVISAGAAHADPARPVAWAPCPDNPDGECGTLNVPLDWKKPWGRRIDLAIARHRATDPARRLGVLVVDPGGPGGSAAEFALSGLFSPEVRARFDIVGIDQRGTGGSLAIRCADLMPGGPSTHPRDEAGFTALLRHNQNVLAQCRERSGPIFDHADGAGVAQDMDAARRALGEKKISYFGLSYGTTFGQVYAERFGRNLRAMVLDSVVDHSVDLARFVGDRAAASDDAFREFEKWCAGTTSCVLHGQDVRAAWEAALVRADGEPGGRQRLLDDMYFALRGPEWEYAADLITGRTGLRAQAFEPNYESVRLASVCQDFSLRIRNFREYERLRAEELRRAPIMRGSFLGHDEATACIGVPGPPANPPHRLDISDAPKILVVNAKHDPTTPHAWAVDIRRQAPRNTALLTYEGWGHIAYPRSACTRGGVDDYLIDLKVPAVSCPAVPR